MISKHLTSLIFSFPLIIGLSVLIPLGKYDLEHGIQGDVVLLVYVLGFLLGIFLQTLSFWLEKRHNFSQNESVLKRTSPFKITKITVVSLLIFIVLFVISAGLILLYVPFAKVGFTMVAYGCGFLFGIVGILILIRYIVSSQVCPASRNCRK